MDRFAAYAGHLPLKNIALALSLGGFLVACGNGPNSGLQTSTQGSNQGGPAPVSLVKSFGRQNFTVQPVALNGGAVAKAVERYRINKRVEPGPYKKVGVDLNGDGQAEALVYLTGEAWCAKTGCTLAIFRNGQFGYRPVATVRRVKLPLRIGSSQSQGWRDLIVNTGGAGMPVQTVALKFSGRGYPGNATTIAPIPVGVPINSVVIMDAPPVATMVPGDAGHSPVEPVSQYPAGQMGAQELANPANPVGLQH